jgi:hypothetical protein
MTMSHIRCLNHIRTVITGPVAIAQLLLCHVTPLNLLNDHLT